MPSIRDLFADPDLIEEGDDTEIDIDKILDSVTDVLNDRHPDSVTERPDPETPEKGEDPSPTDPTTLEAGQSDESEGEEEEDEGEQVPPPAASSPPAASDPFLELPPERRAALLALDQTLMADEAKRAAVFGIITEQKPAPEQAKLPDHIDPDSFEAKIWQEQQEIKASLGQMSQATREQQEAFVKQQANTAAMQAGNAFTQKYSGKLTEADVLEIAKYAGQTGLAGAMVSTPEGKRDPVAAYGQALEATLWSNESFRARVMGDDAPPTPVGDQPEAKERKRKLSAISSSASPVSGPSPKRNAAETGVDGRLTEKSRQDLVKELANGMARQSEGAY